MDRLDELRSITGSLGRIGRLTTGRSATRARAEVSGVDLSRPALAILAALDRSGAVRLTALARLVDLEPPLVSREVRELADAGLVARTPDPEDGRASIIELTASGAECWRRHRAAIDRLALEAFADWTTEDLVALRGYLERVLDIALRGTTGGASPIVAVHES